MLIAVNIAKFALNFKKMTHNGSSAISNHSNKTETQSTVNPSVLLCFDKWKMILFTRIREDHQTIAHP